MKAGMFEVRFRQKCQGEKQVSMRYEQPRAIAGRACWDGLTSGERKHGAAWASAPGDEAGNGCDSIVRSVNGGQARAPHLITLRV
jgi:hypothetical protein